MQIPKFVVWLGAAGLVLLLTFSVDWRGTTGAASTRQRVEALEAGQKETLKQLDEIKGLLQGRGAQAAAQPQVQTPSTIDLAIAGSPSRGRADAKVVMVEFSDFECPFCGRYNKETEGQLLKEYVDTGKVRYVFRHFPLERLHPHAMRAAEAGECAYGQQKFWDMYGRMFENQRALTEPDLVKYAENTGLNMGVFAQCLKGQATAKIRQDLNDGARAGITGTPTFFIGTLTADGRVHATKRLVGAHPYDDFKVALDAALAAETTTKTE